MSATISVSPVLMEQFSRNDFGVIPQVQLGLPPGSVVISHARALLLKDAGISMNFKVFTKHEGHLSTPKRLWRFATKAFSGQVITDVFKNETDELKEIILHSPKGGSAVWIDTSKYGWSIVCQRSHFMAAFDPDVHIGLKPINASFGRKYITGNEEAFWQRISVTPGADPHIFIGSRTMTMKLDLDAGRQIHIHHGALLAATDSVDITYYKIPGFKNRRLAGEGSFLTQVTGPGTVWIETISAPNQPANHGLLSSLVQAAVPG